MARRLKFDYGIEGAIQAGPYLPEFSTESCTECLECGEICPAGAITFSTKPSIAQEKCVGCGLCQSVCPSSAILMRPARDYRKRKPPTPFSIFLWWLTAVFLLVPEVFLFNLIFKRISSKR